MSIASVMDFLLTLTQAQARDLVKRGFDIISKINALILPITFPHPSPEFALTWRELRTIWVTFLENDTPRANRIISGLLRRVVVHGRPGSDKNIGVITQNTLGQCFHILDQTQAYLSSVTRINSL